MFRKILVSLIICVLALQPLAFASDNITSEQIIVAEPTTDKINSEENLYIIVNVTNTKISDSPVWVSLNRMESALPFANELGEDLKVSVLRLSALAAEVDKVSASNRIYNFQPMEYSEGFVVETALINQFFEAKDKFDTANTEYKELNRKYGFDWIGDTEDAIKKLNEETYAAYKRWSSLKPIVSELRKSYVELQVKYAQYFESPIFASQMIQPSFYKEVGKLPIGTYKLRFLDADKRLIKEMVIKVIQKESTLPQITPSKISVN